MQNGSSFELVIQQWACKWPGFRWEPRHTAAYRMVLEEFELGVVTRALDDAAVAAAESRFTAGKIPPPEMVAEYCKKLEIDRRREEKRRQLEREKRIGRREYDHVPRGEEEQARYIAGSNEPFEQLARQWECDSVRLGLDPSKPSPGELTRKRLAQFWAMWNHNFGGSRRIYED